MGQTLDSFSISSPRHPLCIVPRLITDGFPSLTACSICPLITVCSSESCPSSDRAPKDEQLEQNQFASLKCTEPKYSPAPNQLPTEPRGIPTPSFVLSSATTKSASFWTGASHYTARRCSPDPEGVGIVVPIFDRFYRELFD